MPRVTTKSRAPKTSPAPSPAASPLVVDRAHGCVQAFLHVEASDTLQYEADVEINGAEGGYLTVREVRSDTESEVLVTIRALRNDEWEGFVAIMRAAFAERDRLMPAVELVHEGLYV